MIRKEQIDAINRMLQLNRSSDERSWHDPWKVLVYDAFCRDIISPLLKLGDLRKHGITLHLLLDSEREPIPDVPAIYFLQPTRSNIKRLGEDCARGLYETYYINFAPSIPRPLLEELAAITLESGTASQVSKVVDQYVNFVSLEEDFFSLQIENSFVKLNGPSATDSSVESAIDEMVSGLFSAVVTLGTVPVIRYLQGGAAQMVAERLGRKLYDQLRSQPALFNDTSNFLRPLMLIVDRSIDIGMMLEHSWSYCGLCHDLLDMQLNKVAHSRSMNVVSKAYHRSPAIDPGVHRREDGTGRAATHLRLAAGGCVLVGAYGSCLPKRRGRCRQGAFGLSRSDGRDQSGREARGGHFLRVHLQHVQFDVSPQVLTPPPRLINSLSSQSIPSSLASISPLHLPFCYLASSASCFPSSSLACLTSGISFIFALHFHFRHLLHCLPPSPCSPRTALASSPTP